MSQNQDPNVLIPVPLGFLRELGQYLESTPTGRDVPAGVAVSLILRLEGFAAKAVGAAPTNGTKPTKGKTPAPTGREKAGIK